ncbi:MFS transporter [Celerinatantimonas diazotrophica]|uniref:Sugar phosphate permease n=1 Tax=Celerinatantimonas diazotrophica TaxID=412034 RepID=A0A4R1K274_9GAMM|nr:MFS transporter [Celerinatantimonas diazotrophica]TCK57783.1 sugar phosphate permease [Celerinatantimonas diazotrophica]CAG9298153.1 putative L-galactonate transporter [Celerinatantimonas diazotrophica]
MKTSASLQDINTLENNNAKIGGNFRWGIVTLILVAAVINYFDRSNLSIANSTIAKEFGLSSTQMGFLLSAFLWPYAIANLPAGWLVDRFGPKKIFSGGLTLWSAVTVVAGFTSGYGTLYALRVLLGVAESPFFTSGIKVTDMWFSDKERGLPTSVINTGSQIANAVAPPLLTILMLTLGWRGMFVVIGLMSIPIILLWLKFFRAPTRAEYAEIHREDDTQLHQAVSEQTKVDWGALFKRRSTWFMIIGNFCIMFTIWVYLTWLPSYLENSMGMSIKETGWVASIPFIAGILGVLCGGSLSDFLVRKGLNPVTSRKVPIVAGAAFAACSVAPVPFVHSYGLSIALLSLGYFFSQLPQGAIWTLASDIAPSDQVSSLGSIQNFGGFLGAACAPIVAGMVLDATGQFTDVFMLGAGLLLMGAISYAFFVRKD